MNVIHIRLCWTHLQCVNAMFKINETISQYYICNRLNFRMEFTGFIWKRYKLISSFDVNESHGEISLFYVSSFSNDFMTASDNLRIDGWMEHTSAMSNDIKCIYLSMIFIVYRTDIICGHYQGKQASKSFTKCKTTNNNSAYQRPYIDLF